MHSVEIIVFLLGVTTMLAVVARRLRISYPILLVIAGLLIGATPGLPVVELNPDVVFLIFLPPLLFSAAWETSWPDFVRARRPITLLAIGLVTFTATLIALLSHALIPDFSLAQGFLLGAIISPPDAVAAASVTKGLNISKRITTILEGESLVNDATSLIIYRYALAAVMTGQFSLWEAGAKFIWVSVASIALGWLVGQGLLRVHQLIRNDDALINTAVTLLSPFSSYLLAESIHLSGVLAVVTTGLVISTRASEVLSHNTRLQSVSVWETVEFILNGVIFILIGLQLPAIVAGMKSYSLGEAITFALVISLATILIRIAWVYPGTYIPRWVSAKIRRTEPDPGWRRIAVVAWAGMRGVVSLAAALTLPEKLPNGAPFPHRDLILFITFCVILCTLVAQGLSLPLLIRLLGVEEPKDDGKMERKTRIRLAQATIDHLEQNHALGSVREEVLTHLKNTYELRMNQLYGRIRTEVRADDPTLLFRQSLSLQLELLEVERRHLLDLRRNGEIDDELLRRLEQELDLEATRLTLQNSI